MTIRRIGREELKARLDSQDSLRLVMTLGEWQFRALHIPGSIRISTAEEALATLEHDDDIVVYCTDANCGASAYAYRFLTDHGFGRVWHYEGGLADWEAAGYPLAGEMSTEELGVKMSLSELRTYAIRVQGHLDATYVDLIGEVAVTHLVSGESILQVRIDQAGLNALLTRLHNLCVELVAVTRMEE